MYRSNLVAVQRFQLPLPLCRLFAVRASALREEMGIAMVVCMRLCAEGGTCIRVLGKTRDRAHASDFGLAVRHAHFPLAVRFETFPLTSLLML